MNAALRRALVTIALAALAWSVATAPSAAEGSASLTVIDRVGQSVPVVAVLRDASGKEVARSAGPGEPVHAAAGKWTIFPDGNADRAQPIELADGASQSVTMRANDAIWFKLWVADKHPDYNLLLRLKSREALSTLLPKLRFTDSRDSAYATPRPEASAETRAAALRLAREELAKPVPAASGENDGAPWKTARVWANRILDVLGDESDATTFPAAARIESRLGLLGKGTVVAKLAAGDKTSGSAAFWLHRSGYEAGDAFLLQAAAKVDPPWVFGSLLDFPPDEVRAAMVAAAQRYAARAKEIAAGAKDETNEYDVLSLPVLFFLAAYGPDDALATLLENFEIAPADTRYLAVLAADPAQFADYLLTASHLDEAASEDALNQAVGLSATSWLAALCGAAETLPPQQAAALWTHLRDALAERSYARAATFQIPGGWANSFKIYASGRFLTQAGYCTPNRWVTLQYLGQDGGNWSGWIPTVDWIPFYWREEEFVDLLIKNATEKRIYGTSDLADQLDLIPPDRFEALLAAKGGAGDLYPINLYRAYHSVASHANGAFPRLDIRVASDVEERPYVMGRTDVKQPGDRYNGAVSGIARLRPELVEGRIRLHLSLEQVTSYQAQLQIFGRDDLGGQYKPAEGGQRYVIDRGRALIEAVKLWRASTPIPLTEKGIDGDGAFVFEAEAGEAGIEGLAAEVDLAYFTDRRQLVFELYGGDYAQRVRRAATLATRAEAALAAGPGQAAPIIALARSEAAQGQVAMAAASYRQALAIAPTNADLWLEAAGINTAIDDHAGAADVLAAGLAANRGNGPLAAELADALFRAGRYADAAARYAELVQAAPKEPSFRIWQGVTLLLAGDLAGADQAFAALPAGFEPRLAAMLRLLVAERGEGGAKEAARVRYASFADGEKGKPDERLVGVLIGRASPADVLAPTLNHPDATAAARCEAELWVGERLVIAPDPHDAAGPHFAAALANCTPAQMEYHLAKRSLAQLEKP